MCMHRSRSFHRRHRLFSQMLLLLLFAAASTAQTVSVVDMRSYSASTYSAVMLATFAASGLVNRIEGPSV